MRANINRTPTESYPMSNISVNPVAGRAISSAPAPTGLGDGYDSAAARSALDARVKQALKDGFVGFKHGDLPVVDRFELFNKGLLQVPLQGTQGMDQASPEAETRRNNNRTAVYEYTRDFRFTPDGTGDGASLLIKATALTRAREILRDQEREAVLASGTLPAPHAQTLVATLDTAIGALNFIESSFRTSFMQSMVMGDEAFEIEKEW